MKRVETFYAPQFVPYRLDRFDIFLAGAIDNGDAVNWQTSAEQWIESEADRLKIPMEIGVLNPRRLDWDPELNNSFDEPGFIQQVEWELSNLEQADVILFHFPAGAKAPVSMLELGLFLSRPDEDSKVVVTVDPEFYRRANIELTCRFNGDTPVFYNLDDGITHILENYNLFVNIKS